MFGRWLSAGRETQLTGSEELEATIARELPQADRETVQVVAALTGLLGAIAYADRNYSAEEEQRLLLELQRIQGMTVEGAQAIAGALRKNLLTVSSIGIPHYCRALRELGDRDLRLEVLAALMSLAAADGVIDVAEVNVLRQVTGALGLTQDDYNDAQAQHREKLALLR